MDDQNSYSRMLYFSAVTITTLGYGDIVPVTSTARGIVTIEIILGPLLFGLFLNSLVKEGASPRRDRELQVRA
jgi:voltage-gated potassium channel Kch